MFQKYLWFKIQNILGKMQIPDPCWSLVRVPVGSRVCNLYNVLGAMHVLVLEHMHVHLVSCEATTNSTQITLVYADIL